MKISRFLELHCFVKNCLISLLELKSKYGFKRECPSEYMVNILWYFNAKSAWLKAIVLGQNDCVQLAIFSENVSPRAAASAEINKP